MGYRKRVIETKVLEYLNFFSALGITGPRQSGKSTLLRHLLPDYTYLSFDDIRHIQFFREDPQKFMRVYSNRVIFDEVQKVPEIFPYIKIAIDNDRNKRGKFVLTGSNQFSLMAGITESLAGRIGMLSLLPYQYTEVPKKFRAESVYRGSYPELLEKKYALSEDWYASYLETYLNKDLRVLSHIIDLRDFTRLVYLLAAGTSQILDISRYASDLGVDVKTVKRWLSLLEASYIIFFLPPYFNNFGKRIVKSPKVYFYDTGLVSFLTGITSRSQYENGPLAGAIFENFVVSEVLKKQLHNRTHAELYYIRSNHGEEVDLIVDFKNRRDWIEIKSAETFTTKMTRMIESLIGEKDKGYLLYQGEEIPYLPNIEVVPFQNYLLK